MSKHHIHFKIFKTAFIFTLLVTGFNSAILAAANECFPVQGKFTSQALPPAECSSPVFFCTRGSLTGGLHSDYDFIAQKFIPAQEPTVPAANFYTGFSTVHHHRGELYLTDTGSLDLAQGRISALLTVSGGSEYFKNARGYLFVTGHSDFATGINNGNYQGEICVETLY